jgi:hypothetical protein
VTTPVILATQEVEIRKIMVQGQAGQIVHETPSQQEKPGLVVYICHPSYMGSINRRIVFWASLGKKQDPI